MGPFSVVDINQYPSRRVDETTSGMFDAVSTGQVSVEQRFNVPTAPVLARPTFAASPCSRLPVNSALRQLGLQALCPVVCNLCARLKHEAPELKVLQKFERLKVLPTPRQ